MSLLESAQALDDVFAVVPQRGRKRAMGCCAVCFLESMSLHLGVGVTYPPVPPRDDLLALFRAAMANAHDLLDDAQRLVDAGSHPRAHALATLALEEQSKGQMCVLAALLPEISPEHFWGDFRDHQSKLSMVHAYEVMTGSEPIESSGQWKTEAKGRSASSQAQKRSICRLQKRRNTAAQPDWREGGTEADQGRQKGID